MKYKESNRLHFLYILFADVMVGTLIIAHTTFQWRRNINLNWIHSKKLIINLSWMKAIARSKKTIGILHQETIIYGFRFTNFRKYKHECSENLVELERFYIDFGYKKIQIGNVLSSSLRNTYLDCCGGEVRVNN
jgi:hypothetical protein